MLKKLAEILADKDIDLCWSHETDSRSHWSRIADVACSRKFSLVAVPKRKRGSYHVAEVIHEIAHLELWRWRNKRPGSLKNDLLVCEIALGIGRQYAMPQEVIAHLEEEWAREVVRVQAPTTTRAGV